MCSALTTWRLPAPMKLSTPVAPYEMREYFRARPAMRVMSKEEIALYALEAERKEQEQLAALPVLTDAQTVALLKMVDFRQQGSTLCRGIASHIARVSGAAPTYADFHALKELGLCRPGIDSPWHVHTGKGAEAAHLIAKTKARELGLHILIEGSKVKATMSFRCACGQWTGSFSRGPNGAKSAYSHWSEHVIAAGRKET